MSHLAIDLARALEEERRTLSEWLFRQEYLCAFSETTEQVFSEAVIARMIDPSIRPVKRQPWRTAVRDSIWGPARTVRGLHQQS